jgi:hypothetical protein
METAEDLEEELEGRLTKREVNKLRKIAKLAEEAKLYGQAMEDRLSEYKSGIENLGFTRDKKC